ncbi:MAG: nucleotide exchange factor GrpE [Candidatus Dojkabacteria bacterium]|nr:nucleotide exchange factor GrpE [Candidatus Dojkabacteria bacterium]
MSDQKKSQSPVQKNDRRPGISTDDCGKQVDELTRQVESLDLQLKKTLSDYQHLKQDMDKRLDFERQMITADLLRSVIGIADDIDLAVDRVEDDKGWREGVTLILDKMRSVIQGMGAEMITVGQGDEFDPLLHEAVGVASGGAEGTIAQVLQNGYRIGDVIVRPARVLVYKMSSPKK